MRDRVYEEGMGQPPMDDSMGSMDEVMPMPRPKSKRRPTESKKPVKKMAKGGSVGGKAMRGNPKCKMY
jgi:hypothetical protein